MNKLNFCEKNYYFIRFVMYSFLYIYLFFIFLVITCKKQIHKEKEWGFNLCGVL